MVVSATRARGLLSIFLGLLLVISTFLTPGGQPIVLGREAASPAPTSWLWPPAAGLTSVMPSPGPLSPFLVRLTEPNVLVMADAPVEELAERAREHQREVVAAVLEELAAAGRAGAYSFDKAERAYLADLGDAARDELAAHPEVATVEPWREGAAAVGDEKPSGLSPAWIGVQSVSSIVFVQVYSPFVWGRTNTNGLGVELTLETSGGITKAVPAQVYYNTPPNDYVKIDPTQLYFETRFVDPSTGDTVNILPTDRVRVVTSGVDPVDDVFKIDQKWVEVDDIQAWTSYERDTVSGTATAPPGSKLIATVGTSLGVDRYLTPGSSMTYVEQSGFSGGSFSFDSFRTSSDPTLKTVDLNQGRTGFVRVQHPDLNEVYTVHGQNTFVLERSSILHGYAFRPPTAPSGLQSGVAVSRLTMNPNVSVALKTSGGALKDSINTNYSTLSSPYSLTFPSATIDGGDRVEISINKSPTTTITAVPVSASVDLGTNRIAGSGPPNTEMVISAGRISGYIANTSTYYYIQQRKTTNGAGIYTSDQFQCGSSNYLTLQPGSFGYVGYEDTRGNFIYAAFAARTTDVAADFPFIEGWVPDGSVRPNITLRDSHGAIKHQGTATPELIWMNSERLFINVYYNMVTSQFIEQGDTVTVTGGGPDYTLQVVKLTAYLNTDADAVAGEAPAGKTVRVVPADNRNYRREVTANSSGAYSAGNPFTSTSAANCSESTTTKDFTPGDSGRAYVRHDNGTQVFTSYGRSMHVNLNEDYVELYLFVTRDIDWLSTPTPASRPVTVVLTPTAGSPVTVQVNPKSGRPGKTEVYIKDGLDQRVLIRAGDRLSASFDEGPVGLTRPAMIAMGPLAMVTASPDTEASTLAGVGPIGWTGEARLNSPPSARPSASAPSEHTAYAAVSFQTTAGAPVTLVPGYSGLVSFSDSFAHRIQIAWAATSFHVKIVGWLEPGHTQVCGRAPPGSTVRIHDVTSETEDIILGTGTTGSDGNFCVTVSPLYEGQVVMAESGGTFSQPVIVTRFFRVYLPLVARNN